MRSGWLRAGVMALALGAIAACTSPTLPLPPPALPTVSVGSSPNSFVLTSDKGALPNALVIAVNRNQSVPRDRRVVGTIADTQGSWQLVMTASTGDFVDISQEDGATRSPTTTVQLK